MKPLRNLTKIIFCMILLVMGITISIAKTGLVQAINYVVSAESANVYSGDQVIKTLPRGTTFTSNQTNGEWVLISLENANGWIAVVDLKDNSIPPLPTVVQQLEGNSAPQRDKELDALLVMLRKIKPTADHYVGPTGQINARVRRSKKVESAMLGDYIVRPMSISQRRNKLIMVIEVMMDESARPYLGPDAQINRKLERHKRYEAMLLDNLIDAKLRRLSDNRGKRITLNTHINSPDLVLLALEESDRTKG